MNPDEQFGAIELATASELFTKYYDVLKNIACTNRRRKRGVVNTLETTDILHSAYFKLVSSERKFSQKHFQAVATLAIRQVIVDYARKKLSQKRGSGSKAVTFDEAEVVLPGFSETPEDIVIMSRTLEELNETNPRWLKILDARFFAGMTEEETAILLSVDPRTVRRDWKAIKEWLAPRMGVEVVQS